MHMGGLRRFTHTRTSSSISFYNYISRRGVLASTCLNKLIAHLKGFPGECRRRGVYIGTSLARVHMRALLRLLPAAAAPLLALIYRYAV